MFEERYNRMMESVEPSQELVRRTKEAAQPCKAQAGAWKPVVVCVLCVMMMAVPVLWKVIHTSLEPHDVVISDNPSDPAPVNSPPSDELTLSVSDVKWESSTELTFILTIRGDKVDALTEIDFDVENLWPSGGSYFVAERTKDQADNEQRFQITREIDPKYQHTLPESLILRVTRYTSGNIQYDTVHDIDWDTFEYSLARSGSPIIDLGGDMFITGLGFNEDGWLTIQIQKPYHAAEPTHSFPVLDNIATPQMTMEFFPWRINQYTEGDYEYYNTAISVTRDELGGTQLITYTRIAGETILGDWSVSIDLPPHSTD